MIFVTKATYVQFSRPQRIYPTTLPTLRDRKMTENTPRQALHENEAGLAANSNVVDHPLTQNTGHGTIDVARQPTGPSSPPIVLQPPPCAEQMDSNRPSSTAATAATSSSYSEDKRDCTDTLRSCGACCFACCASVARCWS